MPHDANGVELQPGDKVWLYAEVRDVYTGEQDCNVTVVVEGGDDTHRPQISCNSKLCYKAGVAESIEGTADEVAADPEAESVAAPAE